MSSGGEPGARRLRTVRLSVTSRCDLACTYCGAAPGGRDALSLEELITLARAAWLAGARTLRLTGGEPLVREDLEELVAEAAHAPGSGEVAVTTNAQKLATRVRSLRRAGLRRVNIGLPSLDEATYHGMTGGRLGPALQGLEAALDVGLSPVKVNAVIVRGVNDSEVAAFVALAKDRPVEVRFIERMPFEGTDGMVPSARVGAEMASLIGERFLGAPRVTPTAEVFRPEGFAGAVGTISPMTKPFCGRCDRLRVTSIGRLRACLSEGGERDVMGLVRGGASEEQIAREMLSVFREKPACHNASFSGRMSHIGG